jgi:acyl carrier protein
MNGSVESQVKQILADVLSLPEEEITTDSSPETIDAWDSLQHLNLVLAIEQEFGIRFDPEEIEELISFKILVEMVRSKLADHS